MDTLEKSLRRWVALAWLLPTLMALHGAWRGRRASGRKVGRPFAQEPAWLFAAILPAYFALLARAWRPLPARLPAPARLAADAGGAVLTLVGIGLVVWGRVGLGRLYNVSSAFGAQLYERHELVTTGPFAVVRHPMYVGALVAGLGGVLLYRTWAMVLILAHGAVFVVRARREEQALAAEFGPVWESYREKVPGWIPRVRARRADARLADRPA